jgi:16S rRNA (guanine966-N2)-methyltransferase
VGSLRIIAGELRGRRILVPPGGVRPTAERVREALFSILGAAVEGAGVLDAYSGSGALGFEALSRGARHVVFMESDRVAFRALRDTAARLGLTNRCTVFHGQVEQGLLRAVGPLGCFDLVLADPPYGPDPGAAILPLAARRLAPDGCIVVERDGRQAPPQHPERWGLERFREAAYGRCRLDFYRRRR